MTRFQISYKYSPFFQLNISGSIFFLVYLIVAVTAFHVAKQTVKAFDVSLSGSHNIVPAEQTNAYRPRVRELRTGVTVALNKINVGMSHFFTSVSLTRLTKNLIYQKYLNRISGVGIYIIQQIFCLSRVILTFFSIFFPNIVFFPVALRIYGIQNKPNFLFFLLIYFKKYVILCLEVSYYGQQKHKRQA